MGTKKQELTAKGNTGRFFNTTLDVLRKEPELLQPENFDRFRAIMYKALPELADKEHCPNCKASMAMYKRQVHYQNAGLVVYMAEIVRHNLTKGMTLNQANRVHVNAEERIPHNMRCVAGNTSDLGLITEVKDSDKAEWLITRRGFAALRGEPIPKWVIMFRGEIQERSEETTTFTEVMKNRKRRDSTEDLFDPKKYYEIENFAQGALL